MANMLFKAVAGAIIALVNTAYASDYQIGVFYFPGWKDGQIGAPSQMPWSPIKSFPEREPLLGWYDEGNDQVMEQHLKWMSEYGVDFVVFDWYFGTGKKVLLEHAVAAYMRVQTSPKPKFSLLWANHSNMPKSHDDWESMVRYWVHYYFQRPDFMVINGKPVIFIFSADTLKKQAESFGATTNELLRRAQQLAHEAGLPGIEFVAGTGAYMAMIDSFAKAAGYSAFSAYNYHQPPSGPLSHTYNELDQAYQAHWKRFADRGTLPLIVPMTSGWDKRPWGGSKDRLHDYSISTSVEFESHLSAAKAYMDSGLRFPSRIGVICCWNEFGEGSYIEPTKKDGFVYLEKIRKVFKNDLRK